MTAPFATSADVAARWRPLSPDEEQVADVRCWDASLLIRAEFPGIDSQVTNGSVDSQVLVAITAGVVRRAMLGGGDGIASQSESVGPFSRSTGFSNPMGDIYLTESERRMILGYRPRGGSFTYGNTTTQCEPQSQIIYGP